MRILLADDEEGLRVVLTHYLKRLGHRVVAVANGAELLAALEHARFDAIVTDVQMPGVDGLAALGQLRQTDPLVPVVVMTSAPTREVERQVAAAGHAVLLVKPFALGRFAEELSDIIREPGGRDSLVG